MIASSLLEDRRGAAAAEMALVLPILVLLLLGSAELGRYFWNEHVLLKAVRDGAVYASRQKIDNFDCDAGTVSSTVVANTKSLVQTGALSGGSDLLPNWSVGDTVFAIDLDCVTEAGATTLGGIYTANGGNVPVLTVRASLPFRSLFGTTVGLTLNAQQQAAVYGL
jgi:hypothetical protein